MKDYVDLLEYAYEKLNHTLCLNQNEGNLKFSIDNEEHIDCKDADEMVECLEVIEEVICRYRRLEYACIKTANTFKDILKIKE